MQEQDKVETKQKAVIEIDEHLPFIAQAKCKYLNTMELADEIGSLFAPVFKDFFKVKINVNNGVFVPNIITNTIPPAACYANIVFKEGAGIHSDGFSNLTRRTADPSANLANRLTHVLGGASARLYEVTKETYDALEEFIPGSKNPRWNERVIESSAVVQNLTSREEIVVEIIGLSLDALVRKIYGDKEVDENGVVVAEYDYAIIPTRQVLNHPDEYVLQIMQMNRNVVADLSKSLGIGFQSPLIDMRTFIR